MPLTKNQIIPLIITSLSNDGNGIGRYDGQAVFVPFSAIGDVLQVKIVKPSKSYAFGIIESIVTPSAQRVEATCPIYGKCGGCCFAHLSYEAELSAKHSFVADAMQRLGKLDVTVKDTLASPSHARYRNKVQYPLTLAADGTVQAGFFAPRSHRVLPCSDCLLQPVLLNQIAQTICSLFTQYRISVYSEASHTGLARHIYLRHAITTEKVMVCFILNGAQLPHADEICSALVKQHPEISTIVLNENTNANNVITGLKCRTLFGSGVLEDTMSGVPVALNPLSFYQVNTEGANLLYATAAEMANVQPHEILLDLYCGAGTIGLSMVHRCKKLIGVEIIPEAIENAKANAARMGVSHAEFLCADAAKAAQQFAAQGLRPNVILLDPPRKGCDVAALDAVITMQPERIVMISCNPATAARDVAYLQQNSYTPVTVQPVDMFPRTKHVETVVLMSRVENQP